VDASPLQADALGLKLVWAPSMAKALVIRMGDKPQDKRVIYCDKSIYRVINDFPCG